MCLLLTAQLGHPQRQQAVQLQTCKHLHLLAHGLNLLALLLYKYAFGAAVAVAAVAILVAVVVVEGAQEQGTHSLPLV
jgi:hypothetical protein